MALKYKWQKRTFQPGGMAEDRSVWLETEGWLVGRTKLPSTRFWTSSTFGEMFLEMSLVYIPSALSCNPYYCHGSPAVKQKWGGCLGGSVVLLIKVLWPQYSHQTQGPICFTKHGRISYSITVNLNKWASYILKSFGVFLIWHIHQKTTINTATANLD